MSYGKKSEEEDFTPKNICCYLRYGTLWRADIVFVRPMVNIWMSSSNRVANALHRAVYKFLLEYHIHITARMGF